MTSRPALPAYTGAEPCRTGDPDRFFPDSGGNAAAVARECQPCPLRDACLAYALHHAVEGIWGGTGASARGRMRRQLGIVPQPLIPHELTDTAGRIDHERVLQMAARGLSVAVIAQTLRTDPNVIRRHLARRDEDAA